MSKFTDGDRCAICDKPWKKGLKYQRHHVSYEKDITVILCYTCHALLHGNAKIWKHPFAAIGKDKGPLRFARKVVSVYRRALR